MNLNINLVKNKIDSYFGNDRKDSKEQMRLEAHRGELISKRIEENLSKLMVTCEA